MSERKPKAPKIKPFPTRRQILDFAQGSGGKLGKREIARAFHITGDDRVRLKELLQEMAQDGALDSGRRRGVNRPATLPDVAVLRIVSVDLDEEVLAQPARRDGDEPPPRIVMAPERTGNPGLAVGDRVLARLAEISPGEYEGRTIRKLERQADIRIVGVFRRGAGGRGRIVPVDKRERDTWPVAEHDSGGAQDGDLVEARAGVADRLGPRRIVVTERLGDAEDPRAISLIAIHAAGIPTAFRKAAIEQAEAAGPPTLGKRVDLRALPLVTIDGADARDFDDAVWAEPDPDPKNAGGWHLVVAIADVAHYVPPGSPLDRDAFERGNSCYFPDRVVPMLPEALSNGLCSLKPREDRACLAAHLWVDPRGKLRRHRFERGLMRSAARLTYEQVQAARNGAPDEATGPLLDPVLAPLYGAFEALAEARAKRGTLELDLPERKVQLDAEGRVAGIAVRSRLDSHRLIEELMIAANVAAAETLESRQHPALYRIHDQPDRVRVQALKDFLAPLGYAVSLGQVMQPRLFGQILERAEGRPEAFLVNEMILRTQAQAVYGPDNIGHFGLALPRYAHFTSPIRRYADLTVHRGLIDLLGLGSDGSTAEELQRLEAIGEHVSATERRAAQAERDATDRYLAAWLSDRVGTVFSARISGVTRFGLFIALADSGASGLVPISTLPDDFYDHEEASHALIGRRWRRVFRLGAPVRARLVEADPLTGSTLFALVDAGEGADLPGAPAIATARGQRRPSRRPRGG